MTTVMCASMAVSAYAAETPDTAATARAARDGSREVAAYAQTFKVNRVSIETLMDKNSQLIKQITVLQHELKQDGALDSDADASLAAMSEKIKTQRQAIADARFKVSALKSTGDSYLADKDYESAKIILSAVSSMQDEQISLQRGLSDLLQEKLDILNKYADTTSYDNTADANTGNSDDTDTADDAVSNNASEIESL